MRRYGDVSEYFTGDVITRPYRVVVPLDGTANAEAALAYLAALAPMGEIEATLIAVADNTHDSAAAMAEEVERQRRLLETYVQEQVRTISAPVASVEGVAVAVAGAPAASIVELAASRHADLIIISSHSRSGVQRWRLGSVADKVVRTAGCNVLVVGPGAEHAAPRIRSILLPLDGSALAEEAIPVAKRLASSLGCDIHLVRVVPPTVISADMSSGYVSADLLEAVQEAAESYVAKIQQDLQAKETKTLFGAAAEALLDYVRQHSIDMVVMTTHGRGGLMRVALGSVSDRLVGGAAAVFLVRSGESEAG